jgi:hypothetical protein
VKFLPFDIADRGTVEQQENAACGLAEVPKYEAIYSPSER